MLTEGKHLIENSSYFNVMLTAGKHLAENTTYGAAESMRCFAPLNMTMRNIE
jgi:hypothetical protein